MHQPYKSIHNPVRYRKNNFHTPTWIFHLHHHHCVSIISTYFSFNVGHSDRASKIRSGALSLLSGRICLSAFLLPSLGPLSNPTMWNCFFTLECFFVLSLFHHALIDFFSWNDSFFFSVDNLFRKWIFNESGGGKKETIVFQLSCSDNFCSTWLLIKLASSINQVPVMCNQEK